MLRRFLHNQAAMDVVEYALVLFLVILSTTAAMVELRDSLNSIWSAAASRSGAQAAGQQSGGTGNGAPGR